MTSKETDSGPRSGRKKDEKKRHYNIRLYTQHISQRLRSRNASNAECADVGGWIGGGALCFTQKYVKQNSNEISITRNYHSEAKEQTYTGQNTTGRTKMDDPTSWTYRQLGKKNGIIKIDNNHSFWNHVSLSINRTTAGTVQTPLDQKNCNVACIHWFSLNFTRAWGIQ